MFVITDMGIGQFLITMSSLYYFHSVIDALHPFRPVNKDSLYVTYVNETEARLKQKRA